MSSNNAVEKINKELAETRSLLEATRSQISELQIEAHKLETKLNHLVALSAISSMDLVKLKAYLEKESDHSDAST